MYNYFVEFLATVIFTYVIFATANPLAIGAIYALLKLLTQDLTAGYMNPAITIALASAGKLSSNEVFILSIIQIFGALFAFELFKRYKM